MRPRIFIGSSSDVGLRIAEAVQRRAEYDAEITVWTDNVFLLSQTSLHSLLKKLQAVDAAIFVFTPDDVVKIRDAEQPAARDNVVFELGLAIGILGPTRCFIVKPRSATELRLPSDLIGFAPATYDDSRSDNNLDAAVAPVWTKIREALAAEQFYEYPARGYWGPNLLHGSITALQAGEKHVYSLAAKTPVGRPLRVIIQQKGEGDWSLRVGASREWQHSTWSTSPGRQTFDCFEGGTPDREIFFNGSGSADVEIYENGATLPNRVIPISWS